MRVKVYHDVRSGKCSCGSKLSRNNLKEIAGIKFPFCFSCQKIPEKLLIFKNGVKIRKGLNGEALNSPISVIANIYLLINEFEGTKEKSFLFSEVHKRYIKFHSNREKSGEITLAGLKEKLTIAKCHLLPYFENVKINKISGIEINDLRAIYSKEERKSSKVLGELRTILRWAKKNKIISDVPDFPVIRKSKARTVKYRMNDVIKVLSRIKNKETRTFIKFLTIYPIRPCEAAALKIEDINSKKMQFKIRSHFSLTKETEGSKSRKDHIIEFNLIPTLLNKLKDLNTNKEGLVFRKNIAQRARRQWRKACAEIGIDSKDFQIYDIRKLRITEIRKMLGGDSLETIKYSGHTNVATLEKHYIIKDKKVNIEIGRESGKVLAA